MIAAIAKQAMNEMIPNNKKKKLLNFIKKERPNMIILDWCYSFNGDVCMALRSDAILSRMLVEAEMREIGIEKAKLHKKQAEVLETAQDSKVRVLALAGGTGSGKTILGVEVVKIWMSQHIESNSDVSIFC